MPSLFTIYREFKGFFSRAETGEGVPKQFFLRLKLQGSKERETNERHTSGIGIIGCRRRKVTFLSSLEREKMCGWGLCEHTHFKV